MSVPGQTTLGAIMSEAQSLADMVNSNFVSQSEWTNYINQAYYALYDLLISKFGAHYYFQAPFPIVTDGTNSQYALPTDFYKLAGVDLQVSGPDWFVTLQTFPFAERNRYAMRNFQSFYGMSNLRYCLTANTIMFRPTPAAGQNLQLWYAPRLTALVNSTDVVDGVSGWEHYIALDAAISALQKEESDAAPLMAKKAEVLERITWAAENRDQGAPQTVTDSQNSNPWSPWGGPTDGLGGL